MKCADCYLPGGRESGEASWVEYPWVHTFFFAATRYWLPHLISRAIFLIFLIRMTADDLPSRNLSPLPCITLYVS